MSAQPATSPGFCEDCDSPQGGYICRACAKEEHEIDMLGVLERMKTVMPGLTNCEVELLERFIGDCEAGKP